MNSKYHTDFRLVNQRINGGWFIRSANQGIKVGCPKARQFRGVTADPSMLPPPNYQADPQGEKVRLQLDGRVYNRMGESTTRNPQRRVSLQPGSETRVSLQPMLFPLFSDGCFKVV